VSRPERRLGPGLDLSRVTTLLCDADGNLFASEEPAFDAAAQVVNQVMSTIGAPERFLGEELRRAATGRNFRSIIIELVLRHGAVLTGPEVERWVEEENIVVTAHLGQILRPDDAVTAPLTRLAGRYRLAVVSSSALRRLETCFVATALDALFPEQVRYSAADSLPVPTSKPDPAVYTHAGRALGLVPEEGLAVEDATAGVLSAVAAGFPVVGNLQFVPAEEREQREAALLAAGATTVVNDWDELAGSLLAGDDEEVLT